jgi:hypothetical protein
MAKVNQILAIEKPIKAASTAEVTALYHAAQKPALFGGFVKTYKPLDADSERFPDEKQLVQMTAEDVLKKAENSLSDLWSITARKDWSNTIAKADVVVNGEVVLAGAPVSYLLFLEKQLDNFRSLIQALPVLDPSKDWTMDENAGLYKSEVTTTHKGKKVQRPIVLYAATPEHPAQTQLITEDVTVGHWDEQKMSGGLKKSEKEAYLANVTALSQAVKTAREAANLQDELPPPSIGALFDFILEH